MASETPSWGILHGLEDWEIAEALAALRSVGIELDAREIRSWRPSEACEARDWAESLASGQYHRGPRPSVLARHDRRRCRRCGCTDSRRCEMACHWIGPDLCSTCEGPSDLEGLVAFLHRRPWVRIHPLCGPSMIGRFDGAVSGGVQFSTEDRGVRWLRLPDDHEGVYFMSDSVRLGLSVAAEIEYLPGPRRRSGTI